ncbi:hypothetical protein [Agrococcus carbonis]|uniref:Excreted virulence factor EspC, type VII ESX diderm n=1 Tax=Agrococcus carbonis TaxID=684552 RepID=A0A1H1QKP9_9MICO|nr:hypothetical protein [Agrococcus carbonis]SDS23975.1 hypothetical protein SAMN04489719_1863 [Agrococcus carbonis]
MHDVRIDYGDLDGAVSHLRFVAQQLEGTDLTSRDAAAATGHEGLAARVREAAESWDDNRERFQEAAEELADAVAGIAAAFRDLDVRLVGDA